MLRLKMRPRPLDSIERLRDAYDRLVEQGQLKRRDIFKDVEVHEMADGSVEVMGSPETIRTLRLLHEYMPSRTQIRRWDAHHAALHRWLPITMRQRQRNALRRTGGL